MVDWDDVVAVELGAAAPLACPVCLDEPPNAPQVTLCGHSFCFACIARHAVTNRKDGEHAKCPMCFTPVRMADLRSVRRRPIAPPVVGGKMRLTLLRRRRESAVPSKYTPSEGNGSLPGVTTSWPRSTRSIDGGAFDAFAKYTLTSEEHALGEEERVTLEARINRMAEEGGPDAEAELPYALLACDILQSRVQAWAEKRAIHGGYEPPVKGPSASEAAAAAAAAGGGGGGGGERDVRGVSRASGAAARRPRRGSAPRF